MSAKESALAVAALITEINETKKSIPKISFILFLNIPIKYSILKFSLILFSI